MITKAVRKLCDYFVCLFSFVSYVSVAVAACTELYFLPGFPTESCTSRVVMRLCTQHLDLLR